MQRTCRMARIDLGVCKAAYWQYQHSLHCTKMSSASARSSHTWVFNVNTQALFLAFKSITLVYSLYSKTLLSLLKTNMSQPPPFDPQAAFAWFQAMMSGGKP